MISVFRELNRKIFPILTASQISEDFYADFLEDDLGFAILAYYGDMLVSQATSNLNEKDGSPYFSVDTERISGEHLAVLMSLYWARSLTQPKWLPSLSISYSYCVVDLSLTYGEQGDEAWSK